MHITHVTYTRELQSQVRPDRQTQRLHSPALSMRPREEVELEVGFEGWNCRCCSDGCRGNSYELLQLLTLWVKNGRK